MSPQAIIVSAYFNIPSKRSHEFYLPHVERFLKHVKCPMVFFTTKDLHTILANMRGNLPIRFVLYDSIYDIKAFKRYGYDFWKHQCDIDIETYHTPELSAVWYNKKEFVYEAIRMVVAEPDAPYIWCDAGCVRCDDWIRHIGTFGQNTSMIPKGQVVVQQIGDLPETSMFFEYPTVCVAGAIIAGYKDAWETHCIRYDGMVALYAAQKPQVCVNSDQHITLSLAISNPSEYLLVRDTHVSCPDRWFFFLSYFAY